MSKKIFIDAAQYCNWSEKIFGEMAAGGVAAVNATVSYHEDFRETVNELIAWNWRFRQHRDLIMLGKEAADIDRALANGRTAIFLGLQNPSPIEADVGLVKVLFDLGIRFMQLSYNNQSLLCAGWMEAEDCGLTNMGRQVVAEMNRIGMVIDMSHSAERSTIEAIDLSSRPIVISHANPYSWRETARNKSDDVLKRLAARAGMIGLSLYPAHLSRGSSTKIEEFATMAMRLADLIGVDHIGIGSDLCQDQPGHVLKWMREGRWRVPPREDQEASLEFPAPPDFFQSNLDFGRLNEGLLKAGFAAKEAAGILGENWQKFFTHAFQPASGDSHSLPNTCVHDSNLPQRRHA